MTWAALAPHLAGRTPIGFDLDRAFRAIETEFKRTSHAIALPLGIDLNRPNSPRRTDSA